MESKTTLILLRLMFLPILIPSATRANTITARAVPSRNLMVLRSIVFLMRKQGRHWDSAPVPGLRIADCGIKTKFTELCSIRWKRRLDLLQTKYMKAYIRYQGLQRVEEYLFPEPALREALLNAVIHKDYGSSIPIQISVYEDKIMSWNSGFLPQDWTVERLMGKHPSIPYNPLLANAFFRAGYVESWGRGIEKINRECEEYGAPPPIFDYDASGLMLTHQGGPNTSKSDPR